MDAKRLQRLINSHDTRKIHEQSAYYLGKNPALMLPAPKPAPDYRVPVPFARVAVDNMAGYLVAPGSVQYTGELYDSTLSTVFADNEEPLLTSTIFKEACKHGVAYEVHWMQDGQPQFAMVPTAQGIPVWSNDIRPKLLEFVWYKTITNEDGDAVEIAEVYGPLTVETWVKGKEWTPQDEQEHGYGKVPIVVYRIEVSGLNLFDHVRDLMDLFDRLISQDLANESSRYTNAILAMAERLSDDDLQNLKQLGVIDGMGIDGGVKDKIAFITKDIPTAFIELALNTAERLIYDCLAMPNPNDENFASGASGIAQAYKLLGFEFKCSSIESNFIRGLQDRVRMIAGNQAVNQDGTGVEIKLHRNLPFDLQTNALVASQLVGTWDLEAILAIFPDKVLSPEAKVRILEAKAKEKAEIEMSMGRGEVVEDSQGE